MFFLVTVDTATLNRLASLIDTGEFKTTVGEVLPLAPARLAHQMLVGKPHQPGKLILTMDRSDHQ